MKIDTGVGRTISGIALDLHEGFEKDPYLSKGAAKAVGSMYDVSVTGQAPYSSTYDMDVVAVFPLMTEDVEKGLRDLCYRTADKHSGRGIEVVPHIMHGPVKLAPPESGQSILLHVIPHDRKFVQENPPYVWHEFTRHGIPIYGELPPECNIERIGLLNLLQKPYDPISMMKRLEKGERINSEYTADGNVLIFTPMGEGDELEYCAYSVLTVAQNLLHVMGPDCIEHIERDPSVSETFPMLFPGNPGKYFPSEILDIRKRFRNGERVDTSGLKDETLNFLGYADGMIRRLAGTDCRN